MSYHPPSLPPPPNTIHPAILAQAAYQRRMAYAKWVQNQLAMLQPLPYTQSVQYAQNQRGMRQPLPYTPMPQNQATCCAPSPHSRSIPAPAPAPTPASPANGYVQRAPVPSPYQLGPHVYTFAQNGSLYAMIPSATHLSSSAPQAPLPTQSSPQLKASMREILGFDSEVNGTAQAPIVIDEYKVAESAPVKPEPEKPKARVVNGIWKQPASWANFDLLDQKRKSPSDGDTSVTLGSPTKKAKVDVTDPPKSMPAPKSVSSNCNSKSAKRREKKGKGVEAAPANFALEPSIVAKVDTPKPKPAPKRKSRKAVAKEAKAKAPPKSTKRKATKRVKGSEAKVNDEVLQEEEMEDWLASAMVEEPDDDDSHNEVHIEQPVSVSEVVQDEEMEAFLALHTQEFDDEDLLKIEQPDSEVAEDLALDMEELDDLFDEVPIEQPASEVALDMQDESDDDDSLEEVHIEQSGSDVVQEEEDDDWLALDMQEAEDEDDDWEEICINKDNQSAVHPVDNGELDKIANSEPQKPVVAVTLADSVYDDFDSDDYESDDETDLDSDSD